jgi:outer membrane protein OmpA-like peptidoglycan-associated protein
MPEIIRKQYRLFISTIFFMLLFPYLNAQSARQIEKKGDENFAAKNYYAAVKLYSAILYDSPLAKQAPSLVYPFQPGSHSRKSKLSPSRKNGVMYKLAESYRLNYHYKEAAVEYERYIATQDTHFPLAKLWYGLCLTANNEPQKSITAFTDFLKNYKNKDAYAEKAKQGLASANFIIANASLKPVAVVTKLQATVSEDGSDFALEKINDSTFWFSSSRHELDKKKEKIFPVKFYAGKFTANTVNKITTVSTDLNMAASSLSADRLTAYFTGWKEDPKSNTSAYAIFYMTRATVESPWNEPVMLPSPVNTTGFNAKQPFITADTKYLLFSSDQRGGFGKFDIWMVEMNGRKPFGKAVNLGNMINTPADEVTPFYDADAATLYFSSDGRIGMGGLDIYQVKGNLAQNQWNGSVANLGSPVNSVKDDSYYRKESYSDIAFLSSDRASPCCLEIFKSVGIKTDTIRKDTIRKDLPLVPNKIRDTVFLPSISNEERMNQHLMDSLNAITIKRKQVNYNFASARVRLPDHAQLNEIVRELIRHPELNILVASFTDCIGTQASNTALARKRSESVKAWLLKKGIPASRINIDFFGKQHFIMACKEGILYNREQQIANRRSDLILTREQHPKWTPSGKELDIDVMPPAMNNDKKGGRLAIAEPVIKNTSISGAGETAGNHQTKKETDSSGVNESEFKNRITANNKKQADNLSVINNIDKSGPGTISRNSKTKRTDSALTKQKNARENIAAKSSGYRNKGAKTAEIKMIPANTLPREKKDIVTNRAVNDNAPKVLRKDNIILEDKLPINALLDYTPKLKTPDVVEEMTRRVPRKPLILYSTSDSVRIDLYDNGVFDYDTVSVIYDKHLVSYKQLLRVNKPITFYVKLSADQNRNELIFFAENLGLTPPNSALMIITDADNKRTEVNVASDLEHNTVIYFIKVKKEKQ